MSDLTDKLDDLIRELDVASRKAQIEASKAHRRWTEDARQHDAERLRLLAAEHAQADEHRQAAAAYLRWGRIEARRLRMAVRARTIGGGR